MWLYHLSLSLSPMPFILKRLRPCSCHFSPSLTLPCTSTTLVQFKSKLKHNCIYHGCILTFIFSILYFHIKQEIVLAFFVKKSNMVFYRLPTLGSICTVKLGNGLKYIFYQVTDGILFHPDGWRFRGF